MEALQRGQRRAAGIATGIARFARPEEPVRDVGCCLDVPFTARLRCPLMEESARRPSPARRALGLLVFVSTAIALAAGTTGCPKKPPATPTPEETPTAPAATPTPDLDTAMRDGVPTTDDPAVAGCGDTPVYFDLDSSSLSADSTEVVRNVVQCLTQNGGWRVTVEGHADERGSTQYNLALGERRAKTVADYLRNAGIDRSRVNTVSFGEEKPVDPGHDEAAWAKNRRVEFRIRK